MTFKISTDDVEATIELGKRIGALLKGGEFIELAGDLGSGKTTLMKGILAGLGFKGEVPSPTYTISRVYGLREKNLELYHFDFYRIQGADVVTTELSEVLDEPSAIVAVEWSENIGQKVLPFERIKISLLPGSTHADREITVKATSDKYKYIVEGLA